jgi:hypothetical protein
MKKNANAKKALILKLHRETLVKLEKNDLRVVAGGVDPDYSVKFCTEGCPPTGGS